MLDGIFQSIINKYIYKKNNKIYYFYFSLFKFFVKSKLIIPFKNCKFYSSFDRKDLSRWMLRNLAEWDKESIKKISYFMKKYNSSFIDCGCNFGAYSIPIAKNFKEQYIFSFDASDKAISNLEQNINLNKIKNIKYFNIGLGDRNTKMYFNEDINELKNNGSFRFTKLIKKKKVKIVRLDHFLKTEKIKLKKNLIVKIDLEGFDFLALKGMKNILKKSKTIIFIEISKMLLKNSKNFTKEFKTFIKKNKLKIYDLNLKNKNSDEIIKSLKSLNNKNETIGDYIISNHNLL